MHETVGISQPVTVGLLRTLPTFLPAKLLKYTRSSPIVFEIHYLFSLLDALLAWVGRHAVVARAW
jgi:hypothetical protein